MRSKERGRGRACAAQGALELGLDLRYSEGAPWLLVEAVGEGCVREARCCRRHWGERRGWGRRPRRQRGREQLAQTSGTILSFVAISTSP